MCLSISPLSQSLLGFSNGTEAGKGAGGWLTDLSGMRDLLHHGVITFRTGFCHSLYSKNVVEKECLGKMSCSVSATVSTFGEDPCQDFTSSEVQNLCSSTIFCVVFLLNNI